MATFRIEYEEFVGSADKYEDRAVALEEVLKARAESLRTDIDSSFRQSTSILGEPWQPLSPSTVARRRKKSAKPLVDTGHLRRSITTSSDGDSISFGVSGDANKYAGTHQFGLHMSTWRKTARKDGKPNKPFTINIPPRPFLPINESGRPDFSSGRAAVWLARTAQAIIKYIKTGKAPKSRATSGAE